MSAQQVRIYDEFNVETIAWIANECWLERMDTDYAQGP